MWRIRSQSRGRCISYFSLFVFSYIYTVVFLFTYLCGEYDERADAAKETKKCNHCQETESQIYSRKNLCQTIYITRELWKREHISRIHVISGKSQSYAPWIRLRIEKCLLPEWGYKIYEFLLRERREKFDNFCLFKLTKWKIVWIDKKDICCCYNNFHIWLYFCDPVKRTPSTWNLFYLRRQLLFRGEPQIKNTYFNRQSPFKFQFKHF